MGLSPHPCNQPDNLLSCIRVDHPGQDQPAIEMKKFQKTFFTCSFFPNASIAASESAFIPKHSGSLHR